MLNCGFNSITSIDVSQNVNLIELRLAANSISSVDVSQNVNLEVLEIAFNQIASVDVSMLVNLHTFWGMTNNLTSLNFSANPNLEILWCQENNLTYLNVKNGNNTIITNFDATDNPLLDCIDVDDSTYSANNWVNIDATSKFGTNCSVGFEENEKNRLVVFPNPVIQHVSLDMAGAGEFVLTNVQGERVIMGTLNSGINSVDLSALPPGIYQLCVTTASSVHYTHVCKA